MFTHTFFVPVKLSFLMDDYVGTMVLLIDNKYGLIMHYLCYFENIIEIATFQVRSKNS